MNQRQYRFGRFLLDTANQTLQTADGNVVLPPKAFAVLAYLVERQGQLVTRAELLDAIWPGAFVDDHTVPVHIHEVRVALGDEAKQPRFIETRYRRGWVFKAPVHLEDRPVASTAAEPIPETRYTLSGDVSIAYQVVGEGPIDLVFVMGWVSHLEYFWRDPQMARFLRRLASFSRLILFDKRGTGLSDRVPDSALPTLEQRMDDLRAVMEAVGSRKAALYGISEGGALAALFAATYPERTLALMIFGGYARRIQTSDYPWGPTQEEHEQFLDQIRREWGGPVGVEARAPSMATDPAFREWWAAYLRMGASPGAAVVLTRMNAEVDIRSILPTVRVPSLIMHRHGDRCLTVEQGRYVASLVPRAKFVELPGNDHLPFVGDQDAVLNEMRSFLNGISTGDSHDDRVLATVLDADFTETAGPTFERLIQRVAHEVDWFKGHLLQTAPGRVLATFDGPARALRCACAVRRHAVDFGLEFRAGLHTGECANPNGPVASGPATDVAAFLRARAEYGHILATSGVRDLVAGSGIEFAAAGLSELPGLEEARRLLLVVGCSGQ